MTDEQTYVATVVSKSRVRATVRRYEAKGFKLVGRTPAGGEWVQLAFEKTPKGGDGDRED